MNKNFLCTDIQWDTDGIYLSLPKSVLFVNCSLPDDEDEVEDFLSDKLTDAVGFCHSGFKHEEVMNKQEIGLILFDSVVETKLTT